MLFFCEIEMRTEDFLPRIAMNVISGKIQMHAVLVRNPVELAKISRGLS